MIKLPLFVLKNFRGTNGSEKQRENAFFYPSSGLVGENLPFLPVSSAWLQQ